MEEFSIDTIDRDEIIMVESDNSLGDDAVAIQVTPREGNLYAHLTPSEALQLATGLLNYVSEHLEK